MRVYQLSPEKYALQNIQRSRLKVSTFEDLNDPFELLGAELSDRQRREALRLFKADAHLSMGLVCFGRTWENPVMWSHYADKHRGICLGFDIPEEFAVPVKYVSARTAFKFQDDRESKGVHPQFALDLMRSKYKDWRYEKEVRMFVGLDEAEMDSDGLYFYGFGADLVLKEVIVGPRCDTSIQAVRAALGEAASTVRVVKARLAFKTFRVVTDRRSLT